MIEYSYDPPYNLWSGNRSDTLNKWKINYKGSIATASALPEKGDFKGDTYNVLEDGSNYMWNGSSWDKLDANVYVGSTATANGIRGLVPPATTAQMYSLLTGMGTWQSAEDLGLALDDEVVHLTGDETINGNKTFTANIHIKNTNPNFLTTKTNLERGSVPVENFYTFPLLLKDKNDNKFWGIYATYKQNLVSDISFILYSNISNSDSAYTSLGVGYDSSNIPFGYAPSTSTARNGDNDILTRDWIPNDTRIVHTTEDEEIKGIKTFYSTNNGNTDYIRVKNSNIDISTSSNTSTINNNALVVVDKNNKWASSFQNQFNANGDVCTFITARKWVSNAYAISQLSILRTNSGGTITVNGISSFNPIAAGITLGANANATRWGQIYSSSTTIQTSDERVKRQITSVPDDVLDAWSNVNWVQFKMADSLKEKGESARLHNGMIAQQIDSVFKEHNLNVSKYGLFCYDEWEKEDPSYDENGQEVSPGYEAGNLYSLRYTEALCMEAAYQRRRAERAEARIKALEDRLEALEAKLA